MEVDSQDRLDTSREVDGQLHSSFSVSILWALIVTTAALLGCYLGLRTEDQEKCRKRQDTAVTRARLCHIPGQGDSCLARGPRGLGMGQAVLIPGD